MRSGVARNKTLVKRFTTARKIITNRYAGQREPAGSYQASVKLPRKYGWFTNPSQSGPRPSPAGDTS
jgi:hypothetical protein